MEQSLLSRTAASSELTILDNIGGFKGFQW
jgi:hypothetical protein